MNVMKSKGCPFDVHHKTRPKKNPNNVFSIRDDLAGHKWHEQPIFVSIRMNDGKTENER
jgi:hypothetical protein